MKKSSLRLLLLLAVQLCFTHLGSAQETGKTYAETKREQDNAKYNQDYLDALRYNRNAKTKTSSGNSGSNDAAQQLADIFAARAGRETSSQKAERIKKEQENYEIYLKKKVDNDKKMADYWKDDEYRRSIILTPLIALYKEAGFAAFEAYNIALTHLGDKLTPDRQKHIYSYEYAPQSLAAKDALIEFNKKINTASFEELFDLVTDFNIAAYTALAALEKLQQRFPEKKAVIEASYLIHTASFWGRYNDGYVFSLFYDRADAATKKRMLTIFEDWLKVYPQAALMVASKAHTFHNPIKIIAENKLNEGDHKDAFDVALLLLRTPAPVEMSLPETRSVIKHFRRFLLNPKLKKKEMLTAEDLKSISENYRITSTELVETLTKSDWSKGNYNTAYTLDGKYYFIASETYYDRGYDQMLKVFGEQGDAVAMNTYALGVAWGQSKEKPKQAMALWAKSAEAGCAYAIYNMCAASKWGLKWYSADDLMVAKEKLKTFKPATKSDEDFFNSKKAELLNF